jgi:hypothetical protein
VWAECRDFIYKNSVRTSQETHDVSTTKLNRLMMSRETVPVYCENHTEHINTLCGQNAELKQVVDLVTTGFEGVDDVTKFVWHCATCETRSEALGMHVHLVVPNSGS